MPNTTLDGFTPLGLNQGLVMCLDESFNGQTSVLQEYTVLGASNSGPERNRESGESCSDPVHLCRPNGGCTVGVQFPCCPTTMVSKPRSNHDSAPVTPRREGPDTNPFTLG